LQACQTSFIAQRSSATYCSPRCRVAAYRRQQAPPLDTWWRDAAPQLSNRVPLPDARVGGLSRAELGEQLVEIANNDDDGQPKTGRRFYYLALSYRHIVVDMSDTPEGKKSRDAGYKRVLDVLAVLRMNGDLDWDAVLDLTRELVQWRMYESPRDARTQLRENYTEDRWRWQPYYPILIVEKDTMEPICRPIAGSWQMPFASSRGYSSLTLQHDTADALRRRHKLTGQAAVVLFISDLDPSGLDLQRAWRDALLTFGTTYARFVRIGLTPAQVNALANPQLREGIEVKESDSRSRSYIAAYGDRCWETDILPAAVIEQAIEMEIHNWLDVDAWKRRHDQIELARRRL
jgi:hypothetical protein